MKKTVFKITACILFLLLLIVSIAAITNKMKDRQKGEYRQFEGYYAQKPGTVDVLFVGSSRVHCNISPASLWENYGISSYCLGLNSQQVDTTYYSLKEALKYQHPKLVVLEVSQIDYEHEKSSSLPSLFGMKYDFNYAKAVLERSSFKNAMENLLVFPVYHSRFDMLNKDIIIEDKYPMYPVTGPAGYKGAVEHFYVSTFENYTDEYNEEGEMFDETVDGYFDRIVALCEKENIDLFFVYTPAVTRNRLIGFDDYIERHPGLTYLNMSDYYDEMELDTQADFIDEGHMNVYGSAKSGKFLGQYIKEHYDIEDHRGDAGYYSWDENLNYLKQELINSELCKETGFGNYFNYFPNDNYVLVISLLNGYNSQYIGQVDALKNVSCNEASYNLGGTWAVDGSAIIYAALGYEGDGQCTSRDGDITVGYLPEDIISNPRRISNDWHTEINDRVLKIVDDEEGLPCIYFDDVDYSVYKDEGRKKVSSGIEVIVYDKLSEQVVDAVCFDADNEWAATRNQ